MKRSILLDSGADLMSYGMGERSIVAMAEALRSGIGYQRSLLISTERFTRQKIRTVYTMALRLPSYEEICASKVNPMQRVFIHSTAIPIHLPAKRLVEPYPNKLLCRAKSAGQTT